MSTPKETVAETLVRHGLSTPFAGVAARDALASLRQHRDDIAREAYNIGTYCGDCDYEGWETCPHCRDAAREMADAFLNFLDPKEGDRSALDELTRLGQAEGTSGFEETR